MAADLAVLTVRFLLKLGQPVAIPYLNSARLPTAPCSPPSCATPIASSTTRFPPGGCTGAPGRSFAGRVVAARHWQPRPGRRPVRACRLRLGRICGLQLRAARSLAAVCAACLNHTRTLPEMRRSGCPPQFLYPSGRERFGAQFSREPTAAQAGSASTFQHPAARLRPRRARPQSTRTTTQTMNPPTAAPKPPATLSDLDRLPLESLGQQIWESAMKQLRRPGSLAPSHGG